MSRSFRSFWVVLLALVAAAVVAGSAPALSTGVVISQVYGGGGNSGATYTNDFIELFNRGSTTVNLAGWSVQYGSSAGTTWTNTTSLTGSIAPGQYLLIREASGGAVGSPLPTADITGTINMSATAGKVALVNSTTALTGSGCPFAVSVVDFVGYGAANCFEGVAAAAALTNTTAALRGGGGCTETDSNSADFTAGTPVPRNSASAANGCTVDNPPSVSSTVPTSGATNVAATANIVITFSEPVTVTGSWYSINCGTSGSHTATVTGGPTTWTLDPTADFANSETCTVTIFASGVTDQDGPDPMTADYVFSFTTAAPPPPLTPIHTIQGATHISPLNTTTVSTSGIVIAKTTNGFWMQEPDASIDADVATSEGIFVFTSSIPTVNVGDAVTVTGTVCEFRPGGVAPGTCPATGTNLTTTELSTVTSVVVNSTGNGLPAATVIGSGGRTQPTTVIEDDAGGDVEGVGAVFDPASDGIDFYESLEAMRVQVNNPVASGPTNGFGEISVLPDDGAAAGVRTTRGGIVVRATDFNPERVILDNVLAATPSVNTSDHFSPTQVVGVMEYGFGNFKLQVTTALTGVSSGLAQEVASAAAASDLSIATFNVENLDPGDCPAKCDALAATLKNNLLWPDIVALEEIQDNNGNTNDAVVDASATFGALILAITSAGGPTYDYRQIDPVDDQDGGEPGGNIRVGFIFQPARVAFVDKPGSGSTVANSVSATGLQYSPGRILPADSAFNSSRKPLAAEFTFNSQKVFLIANHFNSKGGDQPLFGHFQPPTLSSEVQRTQQAQIVNNFVDDIIANVSNPQIVVLGDFNDFEFSNPLNTLKGAGVLADLIETLPQSERYTYVFDGNSQALDHILANNQVVLRLPTYDVVHVNSEFAVQNSDHEPQLLRYNPTSNPTAAVVTSFSAVRQRGSVVLRWRTGSEVGIAGFNVYREQAGRRVRVNRSLIAASGSPLGRKYAWRAGSTRSARYWLQVVRLDGTRAWSKPARLW